MPVYAMKRVAAVARDGRPILAALATDESADRAVALAAHRGIDRAVAVVRDDHLVATGDLGVVPHGVTRAAARSASQSSSAAAVSHGWRFSTTGSALASSSIWGAVASDGAHGLPS